MDNAIRFAITYPLDSDVSIGYIALSDLYTTRPWSQEMDYELYYDFISFQKSSPKTAWTNLDLKDQFSTPREAFHPHHVSHGYIFDASEYLICIIYSTHDLFFDWPKAYSEFRNQRMGRHLAADYTIIMSRTVKVTGNHVVYDRGA